METESRARVICDYIAGMTDNYILDLHRETNGRARCVARSYAPLGPEFVVQRL